MGPCVTSVERLVVCWSATIYEIGTSGTTKVCSIFASYDACAAVAIAAPRLAASCGSAWELNCRVAEHLNELRGHLDNGKRSVVAHWELASREPANANAKRSSESGDVRRGDPLKCLARLVPRDAPDADSA